MSTQHEECSPGTRVPVLPSPDSALLGLAARGTTVREIGSITPILQMRKQAQRGHVTQCHSEG